MCSIEVKKRFFVFLFGPICFGVEVDSEFRDATDPLALSFAFDEVICLALNANDEVFAPSVLFISSRRTLRNELISKIRAGN